MGDLDIFCGSTGDIRSVSWRYLFGVLEIFYGCPGDIYDYPRDIDGCPGNILYVSRG